MKIVLAVFMVALFIFLILPGNSDIFAITSNYKPLMSVILVYIATQFLPQGATLFAGSMSDPITLYAYAAIVFAIGVTIPVFAYEAYKFIDPALYSNERKMTFPFIGIVSMLFVFGAIFGYLFLAPSFIGGFLPFYNAVNAVELFPLMDFYSIVFFTIIVSGLLFTIPAFFVLLVKFRILKTSIITKQRKYIYAGLAIAALAISPGATPLGDLYLFVALLALIEVSVFVGKIFEKSQGTQTTVATKLDMFLNPTCKYCNQKITSKNTFCSNCNRAQ